MDTESAFPIHAEPKWGGISLVAFETGAFVVKTCEVAAWLTTIAYFLFSGPFPKGSCVSALWPLNLLSRLISSKKDTWSKPEPIRFSHIEIWDIRSFAISDSW